MEFDVITSHLERKIGVYVAKSTEQRCIGTRHKAIKSVALDSYKIHLTRQKQMTHEENSYVFERKQIQEPIKRLSVTLKTF